MRLIRVSALAGSITEVADTAFFVGIDRVTVSQAQTHQKTGEVQSKEVTDIETSTPKARVFLDTLLQQRFYNSQEFTITVRQPRAIFSSQSISEITSPFIEPVTDVYQELWQFSHITTGFIGRFLIASFFLAFGMIQ